MSQDASRNRPQPTKEHLRLRELAGTWNVECKFFMDPTQPPMTTEARETVEMFGEFWAVGRFEADLFGAPFQGRATMGYEPHNRRWVSTWIDHVSPHLYYFTGGYDPSGKILTMHGEGPDPRTGLPTEFHTVEETVDPNTRLFEMFVKLADGTDFRMFSYLYRRAS
jgi:hypothetical protein